MAIQRTVADVHGFVAEHLPAVFVAIDEHVCAAMAELPAAGVDYRNLWQSIGEQFGGGKGLRPSLTLAAYAGLSGEDGTAVVPVAAAMEMLHLSMLIHDDILDRDEVRRGRPNLAGLRRAELANSAMSASQVDDHVLAAALLGGDLALSSSYALVAEANIPAHHRIACLNLVTRAVRTTIAGELLDAYGDLVPPEEANSLLVAELKTAVYSCVVPLLTGAQLAGADPTMRSHLERIGTSMGVSFQLADDDLGVFGDPARTGKSTLSDLRSGKRTELLRMTMHMASPRDRELVASLVGDPALDEQGAARVRDVMERSGAREKVAQVARQHARQARTVVAERVPAPLSGYLADVIDGLQDRVS